MSYVLGGLFWVLVVTLWALAGWVWALVMLGLGLLVLAFICGVAYGRDRPARDKAQERLLTQDDLRPYVGEWVALRGRQVVAHDVDRARLLDQKAVRKGRLFRWSDVIVMVMADPDGDPFI